jgi:hypothetical protein
MIEYCRKKMPKYMVPKTVSFVDELPKTSTGKLQQNQIKLLSPFSLFFKLSFLISLISNFKHKT